MGQDGQEVVLRPVRGLGFQAGGVRQLGAARRHPRVLEGQAQIFHLGHSRLGRRQRRRGLCLQRIGESDDRGGNALAEHEREAAADAQEQEATAR